MMQALTYNHVAIRFRDDMLNLTDMWKAEGCPAGKKPRDWLRSKPVREFIAFLAATLRIDPDRFIVVKRGKNGSTFAHWQIGMFYAKHLSPAFHQWCNKVVRRVMEGQAAPALELPAGRLSEEQARQVGGIVKAVTHHALEPIREDVGVLRREFDRWTDSRNKLVPDRLGIREILDRAGAVPKGRRSLQHRLTGHLKSYCKAAGFNIDDSRGQSRTARRSIATSMT
jgi:hypothetical protein